MITLRAEVEVPPITLLVPVEMRMPPFVVVSLTCPVTSVPMRFPATRVPVELDRTIWSPPFRPERRLRAAGVVPPIRPFC